MNTLLELWDSYAKETQIQGMPEEEKTFHRMTFYCAVASTILLMEDSGGDRWEFAQRMKNDAVNWIKSFDDRARGINLN